MKDLTNLYTSGTASPPARQCNDDGKAIYLPVVGLWDRLIEDEKLHSYILSSTHPVGRFKAAVFQRLGYSADNWDTFERSLRELILTQDASQLEESQYGKKFLVEGLFAGPSGRTMQIVSVWVILKGESVPRFVTAYPGG